MEKIRNQYYINMKIAALLWKSIIYGMVLFLCIKNPAIAGEETKEYRELSIEAGISGETMQEVKKVALTFDDGPHPAYTKKVLEVLEEKNVPATFFVIGELAETLPEVVKQASDFGHEIGNHTYGHCNLCTLSDKEQHEELEKTSEIICAITGKRPDYARAPFGNFPNSPEMKLYIEVSWTVDTLDWTGVSPEVILAKVRKQVKNNGIILMHDQYPATVEALGRMIDWLRENGYEIVPLEEILFGY